MDLKNRRWREFSLIEIFEKIQRGKRLKKDDHLEGNIPYVSSTSFNNGIDGFIGNKQGIRTFEKCLTIANSGSVGSTFYQPFKVIASDHVTQLQSDNFNKYIYLFLANVVSRIGIKYSFNREINDLRIKNEKILLPITEDGQPDYLFMENFMRKKESELLERFKQYVQLKLHKLKQFDKGLNDNREWKAFEIGKLFKISAGKSKGLNHLVEMKNGGINYLGATNLNNGVLAYVEEVKELVHKGNAICFIRNGEGSMGYSIYKAENFIATSDISVGYSEHLNKAVGLFITTVADKIRGKYNFGYKRSESRLKKEKILLPVDEEGNPDYSYMEHYMKALQYEKILAYLDFKTMKRDKL